MCSPVMGIELEFQVVMDLRISLEQMYSVDWWICSVEKWRKMRKISFRGIEERSHYDKYENYSSKGLKFM